MIFFFASKSENHWALSTSGKVCFLPVFGGHSISNELLLIIRTSRSWFKAHAYTHLPVFCFMGVSSMKFPDSLVLVSSSNYRIAADLGFSFSSNSEPNNDFAYRLISALVGGVR